MQMKRVLVVSLSCLMIVACASQPVAVTTTPPAHFTGVPTSATIMPTITFVPVVYPNKLSVGKDGRIKFDNWHVSFSLPKDWDISNHELGFQANPYTELYFFESASIYPNGTELSFDFRPFLNSAGTEKYLKTFENWTDGNQFRVEKYYSSKELGLNLDTAIGYECTYNYGQSFRSYVLRAIYEKESIEIHLVALAAATQSTEKLFLEIVKSISFEQ
jgi:hypothetical protein